jgi:ElaB/YqjD/DUF883 family membrane-anchored ribosome-binding protein
MQNTILNKAEGAVAAAEDMAHRTGAAVENVLDATKSAGKKVGAAVSSEMSNLRGDLDDLISRMPSLSDIDLEEAKEKLMEKVAYVKEVAQSAADDARKHFNEGVDCSRGYVKEHPLQAVGYATAIGFLLGLLVSRR